MTTDRKEARKKYMRVYMREWRKNNPEKKREANTRYKEKTQKHKSDEQS